MISGSSSRGSTWITSTRLTGFIDRLEESLHSLVDNPFMGRECPDLAADVRSLVVDNYLIIYRPASLGIDVVRIVRGSRDIGRLFQP